MSRRSVLFSHKFVISWPGFVGVILNFRQLLLQVLNLRVFFSQLDIQVTNFGFKLLNSCICKVSFFNFTGRHTQPSQTREVLHLTQTITQTNFKFLERCWNTLNFSDLIWLINLNQRYVVIKVHFSKILSIWFGGNTISQSSEVNQVKKVLLGVLRILYLCTTNFSKLDKLLLS